MRLNRLLLIPALIAMNGCEVAKNSSATAASEPDARSAAAAAGLTMTIIQASVDQLIRTGTDGNVSTFSVTPRAPTKGQIVVSLDAGTGGDRWPNAAGSFTLTTSDEIFVPSWPTGTSGNKEVDCTVTLVAGQSVTYTEPVAGTQASLATSPGLVFHLSLSWSKSDATSTPNTQTMTYTTTIAASQPTTRLIAAGSVANGPSGSTTWSLSGTRTMGMKTERPSGGSDTTTVTNAASDLQIAVAGRPTLRFLRTDASIAVTVPAADTPTNLYSGPLSGLPASLNLRGDDRTW